MYKSIFRSIGNYLLHLTYYIRSAVYLTNRNEFQAARIYTVSGIFFSEFFTFENVAEVTAAIIANDFNSMSVSISDTLYSSLDFIIETGPAAMRRDRQ